MIFWGVSYVAIVVEDALREMASRTSLNAIAAAALLIGGTLVLTQRDSAVPDFVRRSQGILWMAVGTGLLTWSLQYILPGTTGGTDVLGLLSLINFGMGCSILTFGAALLWSRRLAAFYDRSWEKWERRRNERLGLRH